MRSEWRDSPLVPGKKLKKSRGNIFINDFELAPLPWGHLQLGVVCTHRQNDLWKSLVGMTSAMVIRVLHLLLLEITFQALGAHTESIQQQPARPGRLGSKRWVLRWWQGKRKIASESCGRVETRGRSCRGDEYDKQRESQVRGIESGAQGIKWPLQTRPLKSAASLLSNRQTKKSD